LCGYCGAAVKYTNDVNCGVLLRVEFDVIRCDDSKINRALFDNLVYLNVKPLRITSTENCVGFGGWLLISRVAMTSWHELVI